MPKADLTSLKKGPCKSNRGAKQHPYIPPFSPPPSLGQAIMFCLYFETTHDEIHTAPRLPTEKNRKRLREITVALIFTCKINSKDFFIDFYLCVETLLQFRLIDHFITSIPFEICRLSHSYGQTNTKESW